MQTSKKFKYNKIDKWKLKKMDQNSFSEKKIINCFICQIFITTFTTFIW